MKHTATRDRWFKKLQKLKPGLSLHDVARATGESYASVYRWADLFVYPFPDLRRRGRVSEDEWDKVDWSQRDADLARELGVSRERVRQVRASRGVGPSAHRAEAERFARWARANTPKLDGLSVTDALELFGNSVLSIQVARRLLRRAGVKPHDPGAAWRQADWRLPNRDLARIWNASPKYVANIRARLHVGPSTWDAKDAKTKKDPGYRKALAAEQKKADAARGPGRK